MTKLKLSDPSLDYWRIKLDPSLNIAYIAAAELGLILVDIKYPYNPVIIKTIPTYAQDNSKTKFKN
jgi:hypothetical protein